MSKHRRKVPLYPCRCNCHDAEFRKMARCSEHSSHSECWREIIQEHRIIQADYEAYRAARLRERGS